MKLLRFQFVKEALAMTKSVSVRFRGVLVPVSWSKWTPSIEPLKYLGGFEFASNDVKTDPRNNKSNSISNI